MLSLLKFVAQALILRAFVLSYSDDLVTNDHHFKETTCNTTAEGKTWKFRPDRDEELFYIASSDACLFACLENSKCVAYTWLSDVVIDTCYLFHEQDGFHDCSASCFSGTAPQQFDGEYFNVSPENVIDLVTTNSSETCYKICVETIGCLGYTWYDQTTPFPYYCFLYTDVSSLAPCQGCTSGMMTCFEETRTTTLFPTTTDLPNPGPPQCLNHYILDEGNRNANYGFGVGYCDQKGHDNYTSPNWVGAGYYRIQEPAGTRIPNSSPGYKHCGTNGSGWIRNIDII